MAVRGKALVTASSGATLFGPQAHGECVLQNRGANTAYGTADGSTAVADTGFTIAAGESVNVRDLPTPWANGEYKFICAATETATIYWSQT